MISKVNDLKEIMLRENCNPRYLYLGIQEQYALTDALGYTTRILKTMFVSNLQVIELNVPTLFVILDERIDNLDILELK